MNSIKKILGMLFITAYLGCTSGISQDNKTSESKQSMERVAPSKEFNDYWYTGSAEITSYELSQARYGEIHKGKAVMIFVTEPFSRDKQVKADNPKEDDYSVLKLNFTKKFLTGIYPYSMMNSSFVPINYPESHALKITSSSQEWCGHVYTQLNNGGDKYNLASFSYFESEGDDLFSIDAEILEDELWAKIRLDPKLLPIGELDIIPALFYIRLSHKDIKSYKAIATRTKINEEVSSYHIVYPELDREITIEYKNDFPHAIEKWEESYVSGWGSSAHKLSTKATKLKRIKSDYWTKNRVANRDQRALLQLD